MLNLKGITAKIAQARQGLQSLEGDITMFCEYYRRRVVLEREQGIMTKKTPDLPIAYAIRVGEIAYNLRSALDHLVWEIVCHNGKDPSKQNEFPIFGKEEDYQRHAGKNLKGLHQYQAEMIKRFQPYQPSAIIGAHLAMLHAICNIDKHRHLNIVALHSVINSRLILDSDPALTGEMTGGSILSDELKGTKHRQKVEVTASVGVCFINDELQNIYVGYDSPIESEVIMGPPVIAVLSHCLAAVEIVVDSLAAEAGAGDTQAIARQGG